MAYNMLDCNGLITDGDGITTDSYMCWCVDIVEAEARVHGLYLPWFDWHSLSKDVGPQTGSRTASHREHGPPKDITNI
jgi:hypothetical protein